MCLNRTHVLVAGLCWLVCNANLIAAQNALIVIGTTGTPAIAQDLSGVVQNIRDGLTQRGFAPDAVEVMDEQTLGAKVTTDSVLQSLKKRQTLQPTDEFWLVLLGFPPPTPTVILPFKSAGRA
jgi:hypothetical protein